MIISAIIFLPRIQHFRTVLVTFNRQIFDFGMTVIFFIIEIIWIVCWLVIYRSQELLELPLFLIKLFGFSFSSFVFLDLIENIIGPGQSIQLMLQEIHFFLKINFAAWPAIMRMWRLWMVFLINNLEVILEATIFICLSLGQWCEASRQSVPIDGF